MQGEHTCLKTSEGYRLARCDMVLNNTSWVVVGESCPLTLLPEGQSKALAFISERLSVLSAR